MKEGGSLPQFLSLSLSLQVLEMRIPASLRKEGRNGTVIRMTRAQEKKPESAFLEQLESSR
jgi:hypothetical protein